MSTSNARAISLNSLNVGWNSLLQILVTLLGAMPTLIANSLCDISFSAKTALILLILIFFSIFFRQFEGQDNLGYLCV